MKRRGFDTSQHRSRKVTADNVGPADLILTSERNHVVKIAASRSARSYMESDVGEIIDPTGSAPRAFEKSVVGMEEMCRRATHYIVRVAEPPETAKRFSFD